MRVIVVRDPDESYAQSAGGWSSGGSVDASPPPIRHVAESQHVLERVVTFVAGVLEVPIGIVTVQGKRDGPRPGVDVRILDRRFVLNGVRVHTPEPFDDVAERALRDAAQPARGRMRGNPTLAV